MADPNESGKYLESLLGLVPDKHEIGFMPITLAEGTNGQRKIVIQRLPYHDSCIGTCHRTSLTLDWRGNVRVLEASVDAQGDVPVDYRVSFSIISGKKIETYTLSSAGALTRDDSGLRNKYQNVAASIPRMVLTSDQKWDCAMTFQAFVKLMTDFISNPQMLSDISPIPVPLMEILPQQETVVG